MRGGEATEKNGGLGDLRDRKYDSGLRELGGWGTLQLLLNAPYVLDVKLIAIHKAEGSSEEQKEDVLVVSLVFSCSTPDGC